MPALKSSNIASADYDDDTGEMTVVFVNGGEYAGVMAQNLEKHPLTAQTVTHTPEGLKVEIGPMVSLLSGVAGRHHERLEGHEGLLHAVKATMDKHEQMIHRLHEIITRRLGKV